MRLPASSLPDLIRQSILLRKKMDARGISAFTRVFDALLPAHDGVKILARREFISLLGGAASRLLRRSATRGRSVFATP